MDKTISSMKKLLLLLFVLIIVISTTGCSTTSNSISPKYNENTRAGFCIINHAGAMPSIHCDPPLVQVQTGAYNAAIEMPLEPGRYKITVTTATPDAEVHVTVVYQEFAKNDKFGIPLYESRLIVGKSNRNADFNTEISIPDNTIGKISIFSAIGNNCGTLIVSRAMA